ncbi:MAG TPA: preprotein translocase subunit YajC [Gemmatimonadaceae bacterium]|nr:preprotein translocase subunit YajC [Gemmatimonadaceae bacterium]
MTPPILAAALLFAPSEGNAMLQPLIMFPLIFIIFYFVIMAPQRKQRQQHEEALRSIKKGDEIVTMGGIVGEVIHIKDTMKDGKPAPAMEDRVTIKSGESRLVIERGRINRVTSRASGTTTTAA